ncbi:hypothetical protein ElyMa_001500100 [Elysia marginata]|uniref:Secreted protein n=1 Tax=Elysia marginata TaxID=1093978 RepID=A0AAV4J9C1_9GAST|nr:hypothetical protein ElyMa_001500100 [Elysia marginata]
MSALFYSQALIVLLALWTGYGIPPTSGQHQVVGQGQVKQDGLDTLNLYSPYLDLTTLDTNHHRNQHTASNVSLVGAYRQRSIQTTVHGSICEYLRYFLIIDIMMILQVLLELGKQIIVSWGRIGAVCKVR